MLKSIVHTNWAWHELAFRSCLFTGQIPRSNRSPQSRIERFLMLWAHSCLYFLNKLAPGHPQIAQCE